ncbi:hydrogenase nickel incorporation protein HypB [Parapedobacter koreensis]|uniref:Hydrogenase nickel incorporation protein HypB n=1 Tax=Parapedobacter koreensis TaxID=332977 RepID=A0A1H7TKP1_9SPHI|nr:hydrogenase nickel incorporation protein HypB [Parapedobacter koreensis]SEL85371.1 hydrogenase nickel incorporation protein HypB [Parapedobacter koreensis]
MCVTCGCSSTEGGVQISVMGEAEKHHHHGDGHHHHHDHNHDHHHGHHHPPLASQEVALEADILQQNNRMAERNRGYLEALDVFAINLVSSPGSGKTSLLERTIADLQGILTFQVIEGDQQTTNDAERIHRLGVPAIQINTGKGCHLDSEMVAAAIKQLHLQPHSLLMIENVGNLVCPAMFDLGESKRAVIISVTEGEDKPLKYPDMFHSAQLCLINKIDLLPHLQFDMEQLKANARKVNPYIRFFEVSATTGEGLEAWYNYLKDALKQV